MMKAHCGGRLCHVAGDDGSALATVRDGVITLKEKAFRFGGCDRVKEACLYSSGDVVPYTRFEVSRLETKDDNVQVSCVLPPHSAAKLVMTCPE